MRDRHKPRLCSACTAPLGRQDDACWQCGTPISRPAVLAPAPPPVPVLPKAA